MVTKRERPKVKAQPIRDEDSQTFENKEANPEDSPNEGQTITRNVPNFLVKTFEIVDVSVTDCRILRNLC